MNYRLALNQENIIESILGVISCLRRLRKPQGFMFILFSGTSTFTMVASIRFRSVFSYRVLWRRASISVVGFVSVQIVTVSIERLPPAENKKTRSSVPRHCWWSLSLSLSLSLALALSLCFHWQSVLTLCSSNPWIHERLDSPVNTHHPKWAVSRPPPRWDGQMCS